MSGFDPTRSFFRGHSLEAREYAPGLQTAFQPGDPAPIPEPKGIKLDSGVPSSPFDNAYAPNPDHLPIGCQPVGISKQAPGGIKLDSGKPRPELIAPSLITALATVLAFGARKYEDRNWEKGISYSRVFGAIMRHLWAWWSGVKTDSETGCSHLWHAACCIMFLIEFERRVGDLTLPVALDDRPNAQSK